MDGTIEVPKVGRVPKKTVLLVGGAGAGIVVYLLYRQRANASAADVADAAAVPDTGLSDMGADVTGTGTGGPVVGYDDNEGGSDTSTTGPTTNAQWSEVAAEALAGSFDQAAVTEALGRYLSRQPLSDLDQRIIQSAIAFAGYPPVGTYTMIPGGNTAITVAPTGLSGTATTSTAVRLSWNPVAGATGYHIYRSGVSQAVGEATGNTGEVGGLSPGSKYTFQVAAHTANGQVGPKSASFSITTGRIAMTAPTGVGVSNVTRTGLTVTWKAAANAVTYHVYRNGKIVATTKGTWLAQSGLRPGSKYSYQVQTVGAGNALSSKSATATATMKK
jgi:hypothetical protein